MIRGRRRIGKSRLIAEFGKSLPCHIFSGLPPTKETTKQSQLHAFARQVEQAFGTPKLNVDDWGALFWHLARLCETGPVMLALDEISWIGSKDPDFLGHLKNAWDLHFSKNSLLVLIVCGSVSSWIQKNILSSTGFVGRISLDLLLEELPIVDAVKFWGAAQTRLNAQDLLKVLSVTGGVPRYLEEIRPELSAEESIHQICFERDGLLYREFAQIFSDLFCTKAPMYSEVVRYLAEGSRPLQEIAAAVDRSDTRVHEYLQDLIHAGFVSEDPIWNLQSMKASRLRKYRLSDNYLRFYLKYVAPNKDSIAQHAYQSVSLSDLPEWNTVAALQFENLVLRNVHPLLKLIELKPAHLARFGPYFQRPTKRHKGCQVDLLIQSRHRVVYLCEIKFNGAPIILHPVSPDRNLW